MVKVFKPVYPYVVPKAGTQTEITTRSQTIYTYGENISPWATIDPIVFGGNHTNNNSILNMIDNDADSYYEIINTAAGDSTTTITFDFGKVLEVRGLIFSFYYINEAVGGSMTSQYSQDGQNWITIKTSNVVSASTTDFFDHVTPIARIRKFRFTLTTANLGGSTRITHFAVIA